MATSIAGQFAIYSFLFAALLACIGAVCVIFGFRLFSRSAGLYRSVDKSSLDEAKSPKSGIYKDSDAIGKLAIARRDFKVSVSGMKAGSVLLATSVVWGYWAQASRPRLEEIIGGRTVISTSKSDDTGVQYSLIELSPETAKVLNDAVPTLSSLVTSGLPSDRQHDGKASQDRLQIAIGDVVDITIFEAAVGGLFVPAEAGVRPGNFVSIPSQMVDQKGTVSVPYCGEIHVDGEIVEAVRDKILNCVKKLAIEPQVVVTVAKGDQRRVQVWGEVRSPGLKGLTKSDRILDLIREAGGPMNPAESWVSLTRGGRQASVPYGAIVNDGANNISVRYGDTVYLYNYAQTFLMLHPSGEQSTLAFDDWRVSLASAIARATKSDRPSEIGYAYLYRGERCSVAAKLGIKCSASSDPVVPVIYQVNLGNSIGQSSASEAWLRNKDVIFLSNRRSFDRIEFQKFLQHVGAIIGTPDDPLQYAVAADRPRVNAAPPP